MRPLASLLLAGILVTAGAKTEVATRRNAVLTHPIEGKVSGGYANDGGAKTHLRLVNKTGWVVRCFVRFPEEETWRETVGVEGEADSLVSGLPKGVYEFAAQRTLSDTPAFWDWGPVR